MTHFWQPASRVSCLNTRTIFQTCRKVDSLVARLARSQLSSKSNTSPQSFLSRLGRQRSNQLGVPRSHIASQMGIRTFASKPHITTQYKDLPRDYRPEVGLPFRAQDLSAEEVKVIFGKLADPYTVNHLLRLLHGHRVAGLLEDPVTDTILTKYEVQVTKTGLAWLRKYVPVDEVANAGLRAEEELQAMEQSIIADAERIGLYKPNSGKAWGGREEKSVLVELKKVRRREQLKEEKEEKARQKSQADEIRQNTGTLEAIKPKAKVELRRRRRDPSENEWYKKYVEAANVLPDGPPEMTAFQRLWPSTLVVLGTLAAAYVFVHIYVPPKLSARAWPDMPPSAATIITIIAANAVVLALWRIPPLYRFFNTYFIVIPAAPNALSCLGNIFSHQAVAHFAANMAALWFVGTRLHDEIGRANFLAVYLCSGVLGSFCSLTWFVARSSFISSSLGASGAVSGVIGCYLMLNSSDKISIFGFPPEGWPSLSAMGLLGILVAFELLGLRRWGKSGQALIDNAAHLGGYATGISYCEMTKWKRRQRWKVEEERRKNLGFMGRIKEGTRPNLPPKGM